MSCIIKNITGQKFGRLLAVQRIIRYSKSGKPKTYWVCQCDCGGTNEVLLQNLGKTVRSCGCLQKENSGKYVRTKSRKQADDMD